MILRRYIYLKCCVCLLSAMALWLAVEGSAGAAEPWWHVDTLSAPASTLGGQGRLVLEVVNLGDAPVDGAAEPVKITDSLPAGVRPVKVYGEGGGSFAIGIDGVKTLIQCGIEGQVVSCAYTGPLLQYERFVISITVEAEPGMGMGSSEVAVSGGGAPPVQRENPISLEIVDGFSGQLFELVPEEEGGIVDTQAGSHPFQLTSTFLLDAKTVLVHEDGGSKELIPEARPVAPVKDLGFKLPPGLVGNPTPLPKCPVAVFLSTGLSCPDDTAVGVASSIITNVNPGDAGPLVEAVSLYSLEPAVGEPARFGFRTQGGPVILDTSVRPEGGSYPVIVTAPDLLDDVGVMGAQVTFWGVPSLAAHDSARGSCLDAFEGSSIDSIKKIGRSCPVQEKPQPFLIMPTSCAEPLRAGVEGDSWEAIGEVALLGEYTFVDALDRPFTQDGCDHLDFEPSMSVQPDTSTGSTPSALSVDVHVDQEASLDPSGQAESTVKETTVALPAGMSLNPAAADGLAACTVAQIDLESESEPGCPEASKIGLVEIHTPLLPNPLKGAAYLAAQEANPFGSLLAIYVAVYDPVSGVRVKLAGEVKPDPLNGQLVTTFKNTPQLPFEDFTVQFFGGSRAPLGTPALCGGYSTSASIAPWSGSPAAQVASSPFAITSGPAGAACSNPLPFAPTLATGSVNLQAGALTPFTMTMSRPDGDQNLRSVQLRMPPGLSGLLTGVALCPEAQANAGECGAQSLIGETTVSVGLGSTPYTVTGGRVYLTGPYEGAPFGLSIVNPAKAGPLDLEKTRANHPVCDCLVVRARIEVDPVTAALTVTSDSSGPYVIPQQLEGIPLQIKHVNVTIDRPGFTFNPTNCDPMRIGGTLQSSDGRTASVSVPFQVTNCGTLAFKPGFSVLTSGRTSRKDGASLHVKLTYPKAPFGTQTNIRSVKVDLPKQLPSRLPTLQRACVDRVFAANPANCPAESRVGSATAITPLIPVPLSGPAYFVSHGGAKFPELVVVLQGYGVTIELHGETFIDEKTNVTSSTFHTVPDAPVGSFELDLPEGPYSALAAPSGLCSITKMAIVKRKVTIRVHGRKRKVRRKITKTVVAPLRMPTAFTAQDGVVIRQNTPIAVSGCPKKKQHKAKPSARAGGR